MALAPATGASAPPALDEAVARSWVREATAALLRERERIDVLNVYPVADGDTGTNLHLTLEAGARAVDAVPVDAGLLAVLRALADGALRGARGSSGAILAQLLRGVVPPAGAGGRADGAAVAAALVRAAALARAAVARPVEGTMLTVSAAAAGAACSAGAELPAVVRAAAGAARAALRRTPRQLDVLRRAGVVDAGGRGLTLLYDALAAVVTGRAPDPMPDPSPPRRTGTRLDDPGASLGNGSAPAQVEVTYLLEAGDTAGAELAAALDRMGDSVVVGGGGGLWSVHLHLHPAEAELAVAAGQALGRLSQVRVAPLVVARPLLVVLPDGDGLARLAEQAGATLAGTRTGTAGELHALLRCAGPAGVVLLPASPAGLEAAVAARDAAGGRIEVVPSSSGPAALAALAVHDPGLPVGETAGRMTEAAAHVRCGSVVAQAGRVVALTDGEEVAAGADRTAVATALAERLLAGGGELVTLVAGAAAGDLDVRLAAELAARRPGVEVVVHRGGQADELLGIGVE